MDISQYAALFHEGALFGINHKGSDISLFLKSADLDVSEVDEDEGVLTEASNLKGQLHIAGVEKIEVNDKPFEGRIEQQYETGRIFEFDVSTHTVHLLVEWIHYMRKVEDLFWKISITGKRIWWQNDLI